MKRKNIFKFVFFIILGLANSFLAFCYFFVQLVIVYYKFARAKIPIEVNEEFEFKTLEPLVSPLIAGEDEIIIYKANPINQFNEFTAIAHEFKDDLQSGIFFSKALFEKLELEENQEVTVKVGEIQRTLKVYVENQIDGMIALISTFEKELDTKVFFENTRYAVAKVMRD